MNPPNRLPVRAPGSDPENWGFDPTVHGVRPRSLGYTLFLDANEIPSTQGSLFTHQSRPLQFVTSFREAKTGVLRSAGMSWWKRTKPAEDALNPDMPLIRLEGISKVFKGDADEETWALSDVTTDIGRGEYVSISGPSGCGKSTLLSLLAMLDTPTGGRYFLNGSAVDGLTPAEKARLRNIEIGLIFQSFHLIADMSVYENVEYPLGLRNRSPADRKARVEAALDRVGLMSRAKQRPTIVGRPSAVGSHRARDRRTSTRSCSPTSRPATWTPRRATRADGHARRTECRWRHLCPSPPTPDYIARARRHIYLFDGKLTPEPVARKPARTLQNPVEPAEPREPDPRTTCPACEGSQNGVAVWWRRCQRRDRLATCCTGACPRRSLRSDRG